MDNTMVSIEDEIHSKERDLAQLKDDITERKAALLRANQSATEIESIISDLKLHIERLKAEE